MLNSTQINLTGKAPLKKEPPKDNVKGVTKTSSENVQPVKVVSLKVDNSETKTKHVRTDVELRQTDKSKFAHSGFPIQKSPSSRSNLPSSWPTVSDFELGWKHPMTLLNDLAGPRLVFKEVPLFLLPFWNPEMLLVFFS